MDTRWRRPAGDHRQGELPYGPPASRGGCVESESAPGRAVAPGCRATSRILAPAGDCRAVRQNSFSDLRLRVHSRAYLLWISQAAARSEVIDHARRGDRVIA